MNFAGRVAVVTGGASGIGAACARLLAAHNARVVVADRKPAAEPCAHAVAMDVADENSVGAAVEEIAAAVVFLASDLASDLASAITGANLPVDAGYLVATPWAAYGGLRKPG